ncbi:hypothetical protein BDA96_07G058000 [Sorghum bicolor]|uniref:Uncharacterized protein n=2 Tax=Sorghum bicolor TaxID=4558 RepID=C5YHH6_SORBI|nr:hypothetical protein SORBI_3007G055300 [Sorghum bicolor]KAG0522675.1 hypothetical protein BDA96_07G058000 [Sorghum bicolor]
MSFKGSWTVEEDSILRDMVIRLGEGKWCMIAKSLPGRIGKQCRERWINHLNPNIKKNDIWTEEEDMLLIRSHRSYGKRWSTIARYLPGRPENDIKNHWNSNKRSLKSKRRLQKKKSEPVPPGQLSILEEYIRSVEPEFQSAAPHPPVIDPMLLQTSVPKMEMHLNVANHTTPMHHQPRAINLNNSLLPDLNISSDPQETHYMGYPMYPPLSAPQLQLVTEEPKYASFPFAEPLTTLNKEHTTVPSYYIGESCNNIGANGHYNEVGPSNIGDNSNLGGDTNTVLELASREFIMPSSEEVSLGLARFK